MKPIVVPVNFSKSSDNAARYAADMAALLQADLHLIHVVQIPVSTAEIPVTGYVFEGLQEAGRDGLNALQQELEKRTGNTIKVLTLLEAGDVEYNLETVCKRLDPFVVVMGTPGTALERGLGQSKTIGAMRHLPYPLIIVPEKAVFHPIRKILLACDLDDIVDRMPYPFLEEARKLFNARFEVVNISTPKQDRQDEAEATFEYNDWNARLHEMYPEVHFIPKQEIESGLAEYVGSHDTDLLVVFPKWHGLLEFHKSHSKRMARQSPVPVMSVR